MILQESTIIRNNIEEQMISIIIRTRNEERWITHCLRSVFSQDFNNYEVIIVDNNSGDGTLKRIINFPIKKIVQLQEYTPGKALNRGIKESSGDILVFLSGHCFPLDDQWLLNLVSSLNDKKIAGVYGRQKPMNFSSASTKRDLLIAFGLDRKIQKKDSFFHNANSAIKREVWEEIPFNENVTNIEDRIWATQVLEKGYLISYEPTAAVYHYHGIHHDGDEERVNETVRVIEEKIEKLDHHSAGEFDIKDLNILSLVPVRGDLLEYNGVPILQHTLEYSLESDVINDTIVLTDNDNVAEFASKCGANVPFLRDAEDSEKYIDLSMVYSKYLGRIEDVGIHPDIIVSLEPEYIFRPPGLISEMVSLLLEKGYDSVVPITKDYNWAWIEKNGIEQRVDSDTPRVLKNPLLISLKGLVCVTYSEFVRGGHMIGYKCGLIEVDKMYSVLEIRSNTIQALDSLADKLQKL
jgi:glycosyltransferase involved in cell wall biosynthesis|tara:strand:- start:472 stop:1866 length:1395 start_codon:yes stop_codon:yes gene_type:complete